MNVIVIVVMVVAVVALSSTLEYFETLTREKLCDQIRLNQRKILAMGARGTSQHDAHFYIIAEGGYMFELPLANLHVDTKKKTTSITIDRDFIARSAPGTPLHDVHRDFFKRDSKFFLISDSNRNMFVGRMFLCQEHKDKGAIRLYDLNGRQSGPMHPQHVSLDVYNRIHVIASLGLDSDISYVFGMNHSKLDRLYTFKAIDISGLSITEGSSEISNRITMDFSSKIEIVAVFYLEDSNKNGGYYYFLDSAGLVTVTRRQNAHDYEQWPIKLIESLYSDKFEVNLKSFILCYPKVEATEEASTKVLPKQTTTNETFETDDEPETEATGISNWTIALVVGIVALVVLAIICYCTHLTIERAKAKRRGRKVRNIFSFRKKRKPEPGSDEQHSLASKVWESVQSKITSLLGGHKKKQAKVVAKGRKGKREKRTPKAKSSKSASS